jgi:hypothetical protein
MVNTLAICELYHPHIHGNTKDSSDDIHGHFIVRTTMDPYEFYSYRMSDKNHQIVHPHIRNYINVNRHYSIPNIIEPIILSGGEMIGIVKTHYIRLFQRKWRGLHKK